MSGKSERRRAGEVVAGEVVASYHEATLAGLIAHVAEAVDRFRAGELAAFEVDHVVFQYSRAAKELWKFCNLTDVEVAAQHLHEDPSIDWWERGSPRSEKRGRVRSALRRRG